MPKHDSDEIAFATQADVTGILGNLDSSQILAIMALRPTVADLEQAHLWLEGDTDVFTPDEPIKGVASEVVTILTENDEDEPTRAR
jgi:hypothetical protein